MLFSCSPAAELLASAGRGWRRSFCPSIFSLSAFSSVFQQLDCSAQVEPRWRVLTLDGRLVICPCLRQRWGDVRLTGCACACSVNPAEPLPRGRTRGELGRGGVRRSFGWPRRRIGEWAATACLRLVSPGIDAPPTCRCGVGAGVRRGFEGCWSGTDAAI